MSCEMKHVDAYQFAIFKIAYFLDMLDTVKSALIHKCQTSRKIIQST